MLLAKYPFVKFVTTDRVGNFFEVGLDNTGRIACCYAAGWYVFSND